MPAGNKSGEYVVAEFTLWAPFEEGAVAVLACVFQKKLDQLLSNN